DGVGFWIAIERSADGEIQDYEEWLVECPFAKPLHLSAADYVVQRVVDEEARLQRIPLDAESMKAVREGSVLQRARMYKRRFSRVAGSVHRRANRRRIATMILHDVELSALRPSHSR